MLPRSRTCRPDLLATVVIILIAGLRLIDANAQSVPPERPRSRPPSELTGWADWEKAEELWRRIQVPPAPPLSPAQALQTFRVAPGYRLELVASEPMVARPIFFEFDPEGRIWVIEYRGYMRDLQGRGEGDPICRVVVLEDTDEDGKADRSTVFLDGLVMPRSLAFVKGGVLVAEPPKLWFCEDLDGDLKSDRKTLVGTYGHAGNPQHTANGLRYGLDNWLHSSDSPRRHRFVGGKLIEEPTVHRGQFGVTFDWSGRFMTCYESSPLHADFFPAEYLLRNPNYFKAYQRGGGDRDPFGVNVNIARDAEEIYPIRVTPAITLGALELRPDGRLRTYTVVAGSCFYDGDQFPADARGNVFIPEAGGHLIGRLRLEGDLELKANRFYPPEQEFLASTDERFRPVNSRVGPDGALYIADMYHGIIEHVIFMVPYLERQIKERKLEAGVDMGRIYRVVSESKSVDRKPPRLSRANSADLVKLLEHANGWWRLTAQRLLVERDDPSAIQPLTELALRGREPVGRLHALWTLAGVEKLSVDTITRALDDSDPQVRATAVRLAEGHLRGRQGEGQVEARLLIEKLKNLAGDRSSVVRLQTLLTMGASPDETALDFIVQVLRENRSPVFRSAAMTGLRGRELELLARWLLDSSDMNRSSEHGRALISQLAQAVVDEGVPRRITQLFELAVGTAERPIRLAILNGVSDAIPRDLKNFRPVQLEREPVDLFRWAEAVDDATRKLVSRIQPAFTWPGAPTLREAAHAVRTLTDSELRLLELGKEQFMTACAPCHQPHGLGLANVAPPLAGSEWVAGPAERLIKVVLHGLYGPIDVAGQRWNLHMPGFGSALNDEQIAAVLSYIRRSWDNSDDPIEPQLVTHVREKTAGRTLAWTLAELRGDSEAGAKGDGTIIDAGSDGQFRLLAQFATTYGRQLAYRPSLGILAPWRHAEDVAEWKVRVPAAGKYEVVISLAADDLSAGDRFIIETEDVQLRGTVLSSGGYDRFREYKVGEFTVRSGVNRLLLRADGPLKRELADVRELRLVPVVR